MGTERAILRTEHLQELQKQKSVRKAGEVLADELRKTEDVPRLKEIVMLLEEAIFNRQQELVLTAGKIDKREIQEEEQVLREVLDLMLETKIKKLGFPAIK